MKRDEIFQSKYLKASDLAGKPAVVKIQAAALETLKSPEGKEQSKTVLYFARVKKALPLNMVNWDSTADICGDDTDQWPGHSIEVYPTTTTMGGKLVDCIRIRRPRDRLPLAPPAARPVAPAMPPTPPIEAYSDADFDDDLPEALRG